MDLKIGSIVVYEGKVYKIVWNYGNGYVEIQENQLNHSINSIKLVSLDEIKPYKGK